MRFLAPVVLALSLVGCSGSDSPTAPSPAAILSPTPAPAPAAAITATLAGPLVLRPAPQETWSGDSRAFRLEVPLRIQETGGGAADWHYARLRLFRSAEGEQGVFMSQLLETAELGSSVVAATGHGTIEPGSTITTVLTFRVDAGDFDAWELRLGFGDPATGTTSEVLLREP